MIVFLLSFASFSVLSGCSGDATKSTSSIESLKKDVLNSACDSELRDYYKKQIKIQEESGKLTDNQLRKSLMNMKEDMNCG